MNPKNYTGKEWHKLAENLNIRQLRNALKRAYRVEAKNALAIARRHLLASGLQVKGNKADWAKGIRSHIYSRGGGFMITVKMHRANSKGKGEKSMHLNRYGFKKPVLVWAEEGTESRKTKGGTSTRRKKGHSTGSMAGYGFLENAQPEMFRAVETNLIPDVGDAVEKVAKKCGFI